MVFFFKGRFAKHLVFFLSGCRWTNETNKQNIQKKKETETKEKRGSSDVYQRK